MPCRLQELRKKEVISACSGCRIGYVDDLEVDTKTALVRALVVYGRPRLLIGLFGGRDDCHIPWEKIRLIGEDAILVDYSVQKRTKKAKNRHNFVTICHQLFL
jgi:YlmC/YmxH family sporulation protein